MAALHRAPPPEDDEVVPSGQALAVVRSWLPPADEDDDSDYDALQDWGDQPAQEEAPRPARRVRCGAGAHTQQPWLTAAWRGRLGLGAKFLSHARAAALMNPLERRLQRQLGAVRAARLGQGEEDEAPAPRGGRGGAGQGAPGRGGKGRAGVAVEEAAPPEQARAARRMTHARALTACARFCRARAATVTTAGATTRALPRSATGAPPQRPRR
jgi:hypothetical protein